jgi:hypothetical protein
MICIFQDFSMKSQLIQTHFFGPLKPLPEGCGEYLSGDGFGDPFQGILELSWSKVVSAKASSTLLNRKKVSLCWIW